MHRTQFLRSSMALLPLVFLFTGGVAAQDNASTLIKKVDLVLSPQKGATSWFRLTSIQETAYELMGQQMGQQSELIYDCEIKFTEVAKDGGADFEIRCIAVRGSMEMPMLGLLEFDSNDKDEGDTNPMLGGLKSMVLAVADKCIKGKVDRKGRVTELPGLAKGLAELSGAGRGRMPPGMSSQFTDAAAIERQIGELFARLPKNPIAAGEEIPFEEQDAMGGGTVMARNGSTKLTSLDANTAVLVSKGTIADAEVKKSADGEDDSPMAQTLRNIKIDKGTFESETRIDRKTGLKQGSSSKFVVEMSTPDPMGGEGRMQLRVNSSSKVERLTSRPAGKAKAPKADADTGKDK